MIKPQGIIPAMVTPFDDNGRLHEKVVRQMIRRLLQAGVHGIFVLGTNGEFFAMNDDEKVELVRIAADEIAGQVPLYAGSGAVTTAETVSLSRKLEEAGADVLSVITPYFVPVNPSEIHEHFKAAAGSTDLPIVLYNIPARTGVMLEAGTVASLSQIPNIVGVKDSSGNFEHMLQLIQQTDPDFSVLAGTDSFILSVLMAGGSGAIAASANIAPEKVVSIYSHWQAGRHAEAAKAQADIAVVRKLMQYGTIPAGLKEVMNQLGIEAGSPRLPVQPVSAEVRSTIAHVLGEAGFVKGR
ncbi:4-hydroxy-tetrahydrodipicolinate synthase [Paenibacillus rhizosphaerae]|uniref:4-hydroxy-tetrahydrodipicolinate synthase n=1 Tax=Paenibacillus rhizosphaerae TaxID=297318 RepID=A0A839TI36_9BACL|nr:4-hydroxy-tetrahydrodipicolinate synthase [Paenibacillus rhizosphaerae]MBB3126173.1 4-hydroxy-tetrahydrodipicolinate synthase [Paenibacillus rhizosphaerae]